MKKNILNFVAYVCVGALFVLVILIANNLVERQNILDRISQWPDVKVKSLEGETVTTGELAGDNLLLLIYFNTECIFCGQMFEEIHADGQLQQNARLLFVSDEPTETVTEYRERTGMDQIKEFVFIHDHERKVRDYFGVRSVPATYLFTKEGKLIHYYRGQVSVGELIAQLQTIQE